MEHHTLDTAQSPFAIPHEDVAALNASEGFQLLRDYLARSAEYVNSPPLSAYVAATHDMTGLMRLQLLLSPRCAM